MYAVPYAFVDDGLGLRGKTGLDYVEGVCELLDDKQFKMGQQEIWLKQATGRLGAAAQKKEPARKHCGKSAQGGQGLNQEPQPRKPEIPTPGPHSRTRITSDKF
eukprot:gene956-biopygen120